MPKSPARERFESRIPELVAKFERNLKFHTGKDYTEADVRSDFIDPLFEALGWDVRNTTGGDRHARDVLREQSGLAGRPDYEFRLDNVTQFYVEAKAPHVPLDSVNVVLQAKKYAHTTGVDFVAITDFEEFRFFDANEKPNPRYINKGLVFEYRYKYFGTPHALDDLWQLSREAVHDGSLEKLRRPSRRAKLQRAPLDQRFLQELTGYREQLAKAVHKVAPERSAPDLNRLVQTFLDRLIFIRVGEDRRILPANGLANIARKWRDNGRVRPITADLFPLFAEVKEKFNGEIFRANEIQQLQWDSALIADVIEEGLSGYDFAQIPVELLGSIYERYLGKTIRLAGTQVKVEDKPEVRKAGGVYYTPKYIVDHIVAQTVGKLVEGKTPKQIARLKILDPACGSGSFLLGAYQYLLDYHRRFYMEQARAKEAKGAHPRLLDAEQGGEYKLPLQEKAEILRNNLFGVDIDAQAVEITMMSLYIKMLEDERGAITGTGVLPRLQDNIKWGNSLIGFDIYDEQPDLTPEEKARLNPFDWHSEREGFGAILKAGGFDAVIGNPPYGATLLPSVQQFVRGKFKTGTYQLDTYGLFLEQAENLSKDNGVCGFIIPSAWVASKFNRELRRLLALETALKAIIITPKKTFKDASVETLIIVFKKPYHPGNALHIERWDTEAHFVYSIPQDSIKLDEGFVFPVYSPPQLNRIVKRMNACTEKLGDHAKVVWGIKIYQRGKGKPKQKGYESEQKNFHSSKKLKSTHKRLVGGSEIQRYNLVWKGTYVDYGEWLAEPRTRDWFEGERILVREVTSNGIIQATMTAEEFVFSNSVDGLRMLDADFELKFILGILNSKLISFFHTNTSPNAFKGTFPKVLLQDLLRFPLPDLFSENRTRHDKMVRLVERMLQLHKDKQAARSETERERIEREIRVTDEQIDELVYALYDLTPDEIAIVQGQKKGN